MSLLIAAGNMGCGARSALEPLPPETAGHAGALGSSGSGGAGRAGDGGVGATSGGGVGATAGMAGAGGSPDANATFCGSPSDVDWHEAIDIWSDPGGVFLLIDGRVFADQGKGWVLLNENGRGGIGGLTGFSGGPLVRFGGVTERCGVEFIDRAGLATCSGSGVPTHVHVVDEELAYGTYADRVLVYDGSYWQQYGEALDDRVVQVWGTHEIVAVTAAGGVYLTNDEGKLVRQDQLDALAQYDSVFTAIWGLSESEIWVGNSGGELFAFDGTDWSRRRDNQSGECAEIRHLWGADNHLFFATENEAFEVRAGKVSSILRLRCQEQSRVWGLFGNSASEVYIAYEAGSGADPCGDVHVDAFDGVTVSPR